MAGGMAGEATGRLFLAGFRRHASYRMATAAGAFTNTVFGLVRAAILAGAVATTASATVGGYSSGEVITYAWLSQALIAPVHVFQWNELAARVRTGEIAIDLARPVDVQLAWLAADLGRAAYSLIPRGLPPLLVGALTAGLVLPGSPLPYLLGLLSTVLAVVISFACRFAVNLAAFWLIEIRGVVGSYVAISNVLCGLLVPLSWFPSWLHTAATWTPFPSMLQAPLDILTARASGPQALVVLGVQLAWTTAALAGGRLLLHRATRKLVVQGG